jgi:hypothetical protein
LAAPSPVTAGGLAQLGKQAQAWQQANPGGNYLGHNLMQAGRNIMAIPGNVASGLQNLIQNVPGMGPQTPPY